MIKLTEEQDLVLNSIIQDVYDDKDQIVLGGYAGCGKTVLVKHIQERLKRFAVCAYTGQAVDVLRRKGVDKASTIHSLIYQPVADKYGNVEFVLKPDLECDGVIIDEASMVSKEIFHDLKYYNIPLIFVGDHGQLPPVSKNDFNIMQKPDYTLETIHRNAGEIAFFAEHIRKGLAPQDFKATDRVVFHDFDADHSETFLLTNQIICAFNATRVDINRQIRAALGYKEFLHPGERVMCLRNDKRVGLFNGMQGHVENYRINKGGVYIDFRTDMYYFPNLEIDCDNLNTENSSTIRYDKDSPHPFAYAYAATCHKCQGSEWNRVCVIEQKCRNWDHIRWAYTAASRAKEHLDWVLPRGERKTVKLNTNDQDIKKIFGL